MKLNSIKDNLGAKIRWEQIEDGYLILDLLRKFDSYDTDIRKLINNQNTTIEELRNNVVALQNELNNFNINYKEEINTKVGDFQRAIMELKQYCDDTFYRKTDKINLSDLGDELTLLLDTILQNIEDIKNDKATYIYEYDRDKQYRKALWRAYFQVSTDHVIYLKNIEDFRKDMTKYITNEEFYGPDYEDGIYTNQSIEIFCFGPTHSFISEYEASTNNWMERACRNVEKDNIEPVYVPRKNIDDNSIYPKHPIFGSVSYDTRSKSFDFEKVTTTDYLFKVVKFVE